MPASPPLRPNTCDDILRRFISEKGLFLLAVCYSFPSEKIALLFVKA